MPLNDNEIRLTSTAGTLAGGATQNLNVTINVKMRSMFEADFCFTARLIKTKGRSINPINLKLSSSFYGLMALHLRLEHSCKITVSQCLKVPFWGNWLLSTWMRWMAAWRVNSMGKAELTAWSSHHVTIRSTALACSSPSHSLTLKPPETSGSSEMKYFWEGFCCKPTIRHTRRPIKSKQCEKPHCTKKIVSINCSLIDSGKWLIKWKIARITKRKWWMASSSALLLHPASMPFTSASSMMQLRLVWKFELELEPNLTDSTEQFEPRLVSLPTPSHTLTTNPFANHCTHVTHHVFDDLWLLLTFGCQTSRFQYCQFPFKIKRSSQDSQDDVESRCLNFAWIKFWLLNEPACASCYWVIQAGTKSFCSGLELQMKNGMWSVKTTCLTSSKPTKEEDS